MFGWNYSPDGGHVGVQGNAGSRSSGLTVDRYVNEILLPVELPYLAAHPWMILQQDNATPHTARVTRTFVKQKWCDTPLAGITV